MHIYKKKVVNKQIISMLRCGNRATCVKRPSKTSKVRGPIFLSSHAFYFKFFRFPMLTQYIPCAI